MYLNVLVMPGALGAGAFEMDPTGDPRIAFTFGNGFFLKDQIHPTRNIRLDRIYLGRRAFFALTDSELCAFIMLHGFTDDPIKNLNADKRLHNADSYATFAVECRTGSKIKPPYVKASTTSR